MSETTVLFLAITGAAVALAVSTALSFAHVARPLGRSRSAASLGSVLCPATGDVALVEIGLDLGSGELAVATCERFPTGAFECDRECFPPQVLEPMVGAWGSPA